MSVVGVHGVQKNEDLHKSLLQREYRPLSLRVFDAMRDSGGLILGVYAILPLLFPALTEWFLFFGFFLWLLTRPKTDFYPLEAPAEIKTQLNGKKINTLTDKYKPVIGKAKAGGKGIFCIGFEEGTDRRIWLSDDAVRTHFLICGTTGSGKTRFLLALLYSALLVGSGAMFIDGKADILTFWLIYDILRRLGREDDLLLLSYLTGGKESSTLKNARNRLSNTNNFLSQGATEELSETIVGLMREAGGDSAMWKGRARILVFNLMRALVELRDRKFITLDIQTFIDYMTLPQIMKLAIDPRVSENVKSGLRSYLIDLPGMTMESIDSGNSDSERANEQNQYLQMQLTEVLTDLSQTYSHIFNTKVGEINFRDVIFNRRILYVMLPALAKSPDSLGGLGRMCIAQVRSALTPALGDQVEGVRKELVEARPADALVPFLLVLDEYGYYAVRGFSTVAAQARSLGIWVCFACQDLPSLQQDEGAAKEYKSILGNTSLKVAMKIEDEDTKKFFIERGEEAYVARSRGAERVAGSSTGAMRDRGEADIQRESVINGRDLVEQGQGRAHFIWGDKVIRGYTLFIEPEKSKSAKLNQFLPVFPPKEERINQVKKMHDQMDMLFADGATTDDTEISETPGTLKSFFEDFNLARSHNRSLIHSSVVAVGMINVRIMEQQDAFLGDDARPQAAPNASSAKRVMSDLVPPVPQNTDTSKKPAAPTKKSETTINPDDVFSSDKETRMKANAGTLAAFAASNKAFESADESDEEETANSSGGSGGGSSAISDLTITTGFADALQKSLKSQLEAERGSKLDDQDLADSAPNEQLYQAAKLAGATDEDAKASAIHSMSKMEAENEYPKKPTPDKQRPENLLNEVKNIKSQLNNLDRLS